MRRAVSWFRRRLHHLAEAGALRVPWEGKMVNAQDADDVDEWLLGRIPPSLAAWRAEAPDFYRSMGVEVVIPEAVDA